MNVELQSLLERYEGVIFDLDNTIIKEIDYLFPCYELIAKYIVSKNQSLNINDLSTYIKKEFNSAGRDKLFQRVLTEYGIDNVSVEDCIDLLRNNNCSIKIEMDDSVFQMLTFLKENNIAVGILTNGNPEQQRRKIDLTDWKGLRPKDEFIVFANMIKKKPHKEALIYIIKKMGIPHNNVLFIGDSMVDEECAASAKVDFVNISSIAIYC